MTRQNKPVIVDGTGYAMASEEEIEALAEKQRQMDAEFTAQQKPIYDAIAENRRDTSEFWDELDLPWWQKLGRAN